MKFKLKNSSFLKTGWGLKQAMRVIKISLVLVLATCFQISAKSYAQIVSINVSDVTLEKICMELHQQTGYNFFYKDDCVKTAGRVTVNLQNVTLTDALDSCLANKPISYKITGKTVVLTKKESLQQQLKYLIKGNVSDKSGSPLSGTAIMIKGTLKGTTTDLNGNYSIEIPEKSTLIFSFLGFQKREIVTSGESVINVVLEEEAAELAETVFISTGYQKIKPEQSTGSLAVIRAKEFDTRVNTTDFLTGLQNKIPGLLINNDIKFEGNSLFQIRGISTINGNKKPLIVVDGYPTELSLDMIDPNEIEAVTVLKDAAAATVYGVRASNGVIVLERKKAKAGKLNVSFRVTSGITPKENYDRYRWDEDASKITVEYAKVKNYNISSGVWGQLSNSLNGYANYDAPTLVIAHWRSATDSINMTERDRQLAAIASYNNTNDYGRLFLRAASTQTYNLNMSGGNDRILYYLTANYTNINASKIRNDNSQFRLSGRTTLKLSERFSLDLTTDFQEGNTNSVPIPDITKIYPYEHLQDANGTPLPIFNGSATNPYYNQYIMSLGLQDNLYYPLKEINETSDKSRTINDRITANFRYNLGRGLNLSFGGVYEYSRTDSRHLAGENSAEVRQYINRYTKLLNGVLTNYIPKGSFLKQQSNSTEGYTMRAQLNYDTQIAEKHSVNLIFGGEIRDIIMKSNYASYFGYNDQTLFHIPVDYNVISNNFSPTYARSNPSLSYSSLFGQGYTDDRFVSLYSNIVYAFMGKYTLTGSIRIDQSNLFGTDPKYKYKPLWSVGGAWNVSKEDFLRDITWLKSLKLRMAYGFNGNVAKNALPQVIASDGLNSLNPSQTTPMLSVSAYANSGLRWEQTDNFNIGIDYELLKGVTGSIDYYIKKTVDILATNQIDASKGGTSALINQASIRNNGLEVSLHSDWITRKRLNWNTGLIFSHNTNEILQVYNTSITPSSFSSDYVSGSNSNYLKGYAIGTLFSYRYAGLDNTGYPMIYDKDGNAKRLYTNDSSTDLYNSGSSIPAFNLGLSNRLDIGNFYIYCMINYYAKFALRVPVPDPTTVRPLEGAGNYWIKAGDETNPDVLPSVAKSAYYYYISTTDKYTVNGSYLSLGDLTASYSLRNSNLLKKSRISNIEIKAQASNIFTVGFNKYNYSKATGDFAKSYMTPTYTIALSVNF